MNDNNSFHIEKMRTCELKEIANILADAFETNPAYSLIFRKADLREGLMWLFGTSLFLLNRQQVLTRVIKETASGNIAGTFTLLPPGGVKRTFRDYLRINLPRFVRHFGISALHRMLRLESCNKKNLTEAVKSTEYYCLSMVVVKEEYRRTGVGAFAVGSCLDELRRTEKTCHLLGLTTQLAENVSFYSRLGFETVNEGDVRFKKSHYHNWNMKYVLK